MVGLIYSKNNEEMWSFSEREKRGLKNFVTKMLIADKALPIRKIIKKHLTGVNAHENGNSKFAWEAFIG